MPRKQAPVPPTCFVPSCPADFVGQAGKVAEVLLRKAERLRTNPDQPLKLLITGAPGIGKTSLVNLIARTLASHPVAIEDVNGKEVGLELAREWTRSLAYGSIFGSWSVKVVNELDRCSKDAQDMLLTHLDRMKPGHAFLGTTNLDLGSLTERFQTRFQSVRLQPRKTRFSRHFSRGGGAHPSPSPVRSPRAQKVTSGPLWRIWRCG